MTRRSERQIERALDALEPDDDPSRPPVIVFEHPDTGEWYDADGDPVSRDGPDPDGPLMIVVRETVVETGWEA